MIIIIVKLRGQLVEKSKKKYWGKSSMVLYNQEIEDQPTTKTGFLVITTERY